MKQVNIKQKILISSCLLGNKVRYNGTDLLINHPLFTRWQSEGRLVSICPELAGGMSTPRAPAEIMEGGGQAVLLQQTAVIDRTGKNVTQNVMAGAKKALQLAQENDCIAAILTERSPSCGSHHIYDGSFSGKRVKGVGVTSALLTLNHIRVYNQNQLEQLSDYIESL